MASGQHNLGFTSSVADIPLGLQASNRPQPERAASPGARDADADALKRRKDIEADDYDPHDHQHVAHPTSNMDTLFHLLKGCFGTGILAMPEAFKLAGYVVGSIGTALIGFVATLAVHMLVDSEYELSRRRRVPTLTYPEVGQAAMEDGPASTRRFAKYVRGGINTFVLLNQMGACIAYIIFVANNIKAFADHYNVGGEPMDHRLYMFYVTLALILLNWIRDLKYLAPFSTIAMSVTLGSFAVILYYVFREIPSIQDKNPVGSITDFPIFFGTAMFSLEAMGVMIPLKNEMKNPKAFGGRFGVLNRAMVPIVVLFICVGLFGYLQYGDGIQSSITLNLPAAEIPAQCVQLMMAAALFVSHGLMNYVNFDSIWNNWLQPKCEARKMSSRRQLVYEYVVRTAIVLSQFLAGVAFNDLSLVISLVGALCLSMIGLTFPAMIHLATFWDSCGSRRAFAWLVAKDVFIAILGFVALVIGTTTSIRDIVKRFS